MFVCHIIAVAALAAPPAVGTPAVETPAVGTPAEWPFDELVLTNGGRFRGRILDESAKGVRFQTVRRSPGRPTVTLTLLFTPDEIARVVRLSAGDRAVLAEKLAGLDPHGSGEREKMAELALAPADWFGRPGAALSYESDQFTLISGASEEVTRRAAVRLEQIYTAFARLLPPRELAAPAAKTTTVYLAGSPEEYAKLLGPAVGRLLNPAVYDPVGNRIVCGSDLRRLGQELTATRLSHAQQLAGVDRYEADVRAAYRGRKPDLDRFLALARRERRRVWAAERANDRAFDQATRRLFALLYHEAFHSYAGTFVYPPLPADRVKAGGGPGELPRWLNEGLAQIFETAVVEAGELRVGHADEDRLARVRALLAETAPGGLVPVADLLRADEASFLAAHAGDRGPADRAYLTSWAVAFHLTFDRHAVGTPKFEAFLREVNAGGNPVAAFEALVGRSVPDYERELRELSGAATSGRYAPPGVNRRVASGKIKEPGESESIGMVSATVSIRPPPCTLIDRTP